MNITSPVFSIIIPFYGKESDLRSCLTALTESSYEQFECIVVNDGWEGDLSWIEEEFDVKYFRIQNSGCNVARRFGVSRASHDWLLFVDADCSVHRDTLEVMAGYIKNNPDEVALIGSYDDKPHAKPWVSQYRNLLHHFTHQSAPDHINSFWTGCGAIRKDIWDKLGGVTSNREGIRDIELGYKLAEAGHLVRVCKDVQVTHLKEWSWYSMIKTDLFKRAIPWTRLLINNRLPELNLNVSRGNMLSVLFVGITLMLLFLKPKTAFYSYSGFILMNLKLWRFLSSKHGLIFGIFSVFAHTVFQLTSILGLILGVCSHMMDSHESRLNPSDSKR